MTEEKAEARQAVRAAQKQFERERKDSQRSRRQAFAKAQKAGLSTGNGYTDVRRAIG